MKRIHVLVPLAHDLAEGGLCLGKNTKTRLAKAARIYHQLGESYQEVIIVLSAGYADADGRIKAHPRQRESMARLMKEHLALHYGITDGVYIPRNTWGTRAEVESARIFAENRYKHQAVTYHFITAWWHIPRTFLNAWHILPGVERRWHATKSTWEMDAVREGYKIPGELLRTLFPQFGEMLKEHRGRD